MRCRLRVVGNPDATINVERDARKLLRFAIAALLDVVDELTTRPSFDELLERIREIRASERRFYQKITDIYAQCSMDYDPKANTTQTFYKTVQNKLHWAITGHTAAEPTSDSNAETADRSLGAA